MARPGDPDRLPQSEFNNNVIERCDVTTDNLLTLCSKGGRALFAAQYPGAMGLCGLQLSGLEER
jgi:hypothetical protein